MKTKESNSPILERLFESIIRNGLILPNEKILVAFSGGADSVALLSMLEKLSKRLNIELFAAHLNHGIRGEEADRDQQFCVEMCREKGIVLETKRVSVPAEAERTGEGLEECARRIRYAFLNECAEKHGCAKIATAHHADDNIETVLLHLIRGTGLSGLVGISAKRDNIIRPLLPFRKNELLAYLKSENIGFVFDSTNSDIKMTRNKIRHKLLDTVYEINPKADAAFLNMSRLVEEDNRYLLSLASDINKDATLAELKELPLPILSRFLQLRYTEYVKEKAKETGYTEDEKQSLSPPCIFEGGKEIFSQALISESGKETPSRLSKVRPAQLSNVHLAPITEFIKMGTGNADFSLPGKITAHISTHGVHFSVTGSDDVEDFEIPLKMGENNISQCRCKILITNDKNVAEEWQNIYKLSIPASVNFDTIIDGNAPGLFVRSKRLGDSYVYGGHTRSVRRRLIDLKIPAYKRNRLPRVCDGDGIIWVPNLRVADRVRTSRGKNLLYIVYADTEKTGCV